MFKGIKYVYKNVDDVGGGDGGAPTSSIADALSTGGDGQENGQGGQPSLLSTGSNEQNGTDTETESLSFPEKYTVKNEDGSLNIEASTKKLVEGYTNLSKKMGETGGVVPDTADGYKIEFDREALGLPETVTPELLESDPDFKSFCEEAHKAGFTNEQINLVAGKYLGVVQSLIDRRDENDIAACRTALMENWKTPAEMESGIKNAIKAFNHFASDEDKALMDTIGNNPLVVRLLSNIGAQMREDSPARNTQPTESRETIRSLMMSEAYQDPKHPDHERVSRQVTQYYQQTVGDDEVL